MQGWTTTWCIELQEKEEKDEKYRGRLLRKNTKIKGASFSSIKMNKPLLAQVYGVPYVRFKFRSHH